MYNINDPVGASVYVWISAVLSVRGFSSSLFRAIIFCTIPRRLVTVLIFPGSVHGIAYHGNPPKGLEKSGAYSKSWDSWILIPVGESLSCSSIMVRQLIILGFPAGLVTSSVKTSYLNSNLVFYPVDMAFHYS